MEQLPHTYRPHTSERARLERLDRDGVSRKRTNIAVHDPGFSTAIRLGPTALYAFANRANSATTRS
jgi:hypothetical protein